MTLSLLFGGACAAQRPSSTGSASRAPNQLPKVLFEETFGSLDAIRQNWLAVLPEATGATVSIEDGALRMTLPSSGELRLTRQIDLLATRGMRLHVLARARSSSSRASARVSLSAGDSAQTYGERLYGGSVIAESWADIDAIVDVEEDSARAELALVIAGSGDVWFDDVRVEIVSPVPRPARSSLSAQQLENVEALTRVVTMLRYRHPADQSAQLDWNAFLPTAIDRILQVPSREALRSELREMFKSIAPTVEFSETSTYTTHATPAAGSHLVRWQRFGLGSGSTFFGWREGRDSDQAGVRVDTPLGIPNLSHCKQARLFATGRRWGDGEASVYATANQPGETTKQFDVKLTSQDSTVMVDVDVTPDTFDIHTGVKLDGRAGVELTTLSLACNGNERVAVDFARAAWAHLGTDALYTYRTRDCASGVCLVVERQPLDTRFVRDRDVLDAEIADHLWIHVPLAVWADDTQTLPVSDSARVTSRYGATDLPSRLAVVASAWGTLSLFYPYFADQHLDWQRELRPALVRAATAGSLVEISRALFVLLASLHDNHARAYHPSIQSDGVLPLALRRFGDTLVVVGTLADYAKRIPIGTEIVSIDGIQAEHAYADMLEHTPSATAGWSGAIVPFWLTVGRLGALAVVRMRTPDGSTRALLLPHLSRELYDDVLREPMPATGTELQAGVYYVDLNELKLARWQAVLPSLSHARVMILDMRGYPTNAAFTILGHFSGREIPSLQWLVPALGTRDFKKSSWTIRPVAPKLDAKLIVLLDGRAVSAAETVLQLVHDNHLGVLVGEASAGSNGNVIVSELPAGFSMRFTGLRVLLADGTALQGRGIMPDHVVHPTLAGVRAGRDEILEAALQLASRL